MSERDALKRQLFGEDSHVHLLRALEGLDAQQAGAQPTGTLHSIFQLVKHMSYWQEIALRRIRGERPARPAHAAHGWTAPVAPHDDAEWRDAVEELSSGLWELEAALDSPEVDLDAVTEPEPRRTVRTEVLMLLCHNSHHLGQIVSLRQRLGAWPPPGGGDTW